MVSCRRPGTLVTMTKLTSDEIEFLRNSNIRRNDRPRKTRKVSSRPLFPKKTIIAVGVIGILLVIAVISVLGDLKPYSDLANSSSWSAISKMATGDSGVKSGADQVEMANGLYAMQGPIVTGIIIACVIIAAIIIGIWYLRVWSWEDERKEARNGSSHDQKKKVHHSDGGSRRPRHHSGSGPRRS